MRKIRIEIREYIKQGLEDEWVEIGIPYAMFQVKFKNTDWTEEDLEYFFNLFKVGYEKKDKGKGD